MGRVYNFTQYGKTCFEFYKTIAPTTETRSWEELSDFARAEWTRTALLHTPTADRRPPER